MRITITPLLKEKKRRGGKRATEKEEGTKKKYKWKEEKKIARQSTINHPRIVSDNCDINAYVLPMCICGYSIFILQVKRHKEPKQNILSYI